MTKRGLNLFFVSNCIVFEDPQGGEGGVTYHLLPMFPLKHNHGTSILWNNFCALSQRAAKWRGLCFGRFSMTL